MNSKNNNNHSNEEENSFSKKGEITFIFATFFIGFSIAVFVHSNLEKKENNSENSITYLKQDFYEIYNQSKNEDIKVNNEEVKNKIYSLYKTKLKYMPHMEYGQYVEKIESGDFVSQQNIYNPVKQTVVKVFSDQYGQQYAISSINNNENNANISPYYENIISLNSIEKLDKSNETGNIYSLWYQHNRKGIQQFLGSEEKEVLTQVEQSDCQCNKDKDLENVSKHDFARDIENFVNHQYLEKFNHLPDLQYGQYVKKLKSGSFEYYQKVYNFSNNENNIVMTDQHGQQYNILMIANNENNALFSKYYEDIKILQPVSNQSYFGEKASWDTKNIDWFKNNKEALRSFMDENS